MNGFFKETADVGNETEKEKNFFAEEPFSSLFDEPGSIGDDLPEPVEPESDETGTRGLTENEQQELKEKTEWTDMQLDRCSAKEDGTIVYRCDKEVNNNSGVEYVTKVVEINGVKVEVTVPEFDSKFDAQLSEGNYEKSNSAQFRECNEQLKEAIEKNPELRKQFNEEEIKQIEAGETPDGYVWHHDAEPGKMQLVKESDHDRRTGGAPHTGGKTLWGGGYPSQARKGESF